MVATDRIPNKPTSAEHINAPAPCVEKPVAPDNVNRPDGMDVLGGMGRPGGMGGPG